MVYRVKHKIHGNNNNTGKNTKIQGNKVSSLEKSVIDEKIEKAAGLVSWDNPLSNFDWINQPLICVVESVFGFMFILYPQTEKQVAISYKQNAILNQINMETNMVLMVRKRHIVVDLL